MKRLAPLLALLLVACIDLPPVQPNRPMVSPSPTLEPPSLVKPTQDPGELTSSIEAGVASWYDDGPGLYAAVNSYRWGDPRYAITVCRQDDASRCVTVTVRYCCDCPGARIVDLSPAAFRRLAPLSAGLVKVTVQEGRGVTVRANPTPPATDIFSERTSP